jgi:hypothetical protein
MRKLTDDEQAIGKIALFIIIVITAYYFVPLMIRKW